MMTGIGLALVAIAISLFAWADSLRMATSPNSLELMILASLAGAFLASGLTLIWMWFPYEYSLQHGEPGQKPLPISGERPKFRWRNLIRIADVLPRPRIGFGLALAIPVLLFVLLIAAYVAQAVLWFVSYEVPKPLSSGQQEIMIDYLKEQQRGDVRVRIRIDRDNDVRSIQFARQLEFICQQSGCLEIAKPTINQRSNAPRGVCLIAEPEDVSALYLSKALDDVGFVMNQRMTDYDMHKANYVLITLRNGWWPL